MARTHHDLPPERSRASTAGEADAVLDAHEIGRRATVGVVQVASRGVAIRILGFFGTLVLARLLTPADFGVITLGLTVATLGGTVTDAGLGAALIRSPRVPTRQELAAVLGWQLLVAFTVIAGVVAVALVSGDPHAWIVLLMSCVLIPGAYKVPAGVSLERDLRFGPIAIVETAEVLSFNVLAVSFVAAGMGTTGVAAALVARGVFGAAMLTMLSPARVLVPRPAWASVKPLLRFGLVYQGIGVVNVVRDQVLNVGVGAIAGLSTLGVWGLAFRILQVPFLLFDTVWRVSYPMFARLRDTEADIGPVVRKIVATAAVGVGVLIVPLMGAGPDSTAVLFGVEWREAWTVLPYAGAGMMIGGPISVAVAGVLLAAGRPKIVMVSAIVHTVVWFAVTFSLVSTLGVEALGIGWLVSALAEAVILALVSRSMLDVDFARPLAVPASLGAAAAVCGYLVSRVLDGGWAGTLAGAATGEVLFIALCATLHPLALRALRDVVTTGLARKAAP